VGYFFAKSAQRAFNPRRRTPFGGQLNWGLDGANDAYNNIDWKKICECPQ
jgi:hypothetical protein